jgi:ABC-type nitrate/sulfonate/bicarbonate transport system permease component
MFIFSQITKHKLSLLSISIFFVVWEIISRMKFVDPLFISSPSKVILAGYSLTSSGEIFPHLFASIESLLAGLFLAVFFGVVAGLLISSDKILYKLFSPYVYALNSLPTIAIIPLIIIWLGIGIYAKIGIVFLMALKPILINTIDGVRNIDIRLIGMAKSFGAEKLFILKTIVFFSILGFVFSGIRISIGRSITGLVVGEAFGYGKGLGFLVSFYGMTFNTSRLMFVVLVLLAISIALSEFVFLAEKKLLKWKH